MATAYYAATAAVWYEWTCGNATETSSDTSCVWCDWCNSTATTSTASVTVGVWRTWSSTTDCAYRFTPATAPQPLTPEERARLAEEQAKRAEAARLASEEARRKAELAQARAEKLLHELLDAEQKRQYAADKSFEMVGADNERYRIRPAWSGHVDRLKDGKPVERFCIHPGGVSVPIPDNQLIAKLMLETDPAGFRRIANVTRLQPVG